MGHGWRAFAACSTRSLVFDAGPPERIFSFTEGQVLLDLPAAQHKAVSEPPADPFGLAVQTHLRMKVDDNSVSIDQEPLGLAGPFGPGSAPLPDMLSNRCDAAVGA